MVANLQWVNNFSQFYLFGFVVQQYWSIPNSNYWYCEHTICMLFCSRLVGYLFFRVSFSLFLRANHIADTFLMITSIILVLPSFRNSPVYPYFTIFPAIRMYRIIALIPPLRDLMVILGLMWYIRFFFIDSNITPPPSIVVGSPPKCAGNCEFVLVYDYDLFNSSHGC